MKFDEMDLYSCEYCGAITDIIVLKEKRERKDLQIQMEEDSSNNYDYKDFYEFIHFRCCNCKKINQIRE